MSLKFVLPKLDSLLLKDLKAGPEDPRKYVHVIHGHAIVQNNLITIVNLREYVKIECEITDEEQLEELTNIINWMEGKSFPADFWAELTKEHLVDLVDKGLEVSTLNYSKVLMYEDVAVPLNTVIDVITSNLNKTSVLIDCIAVNSDLLNKLNTAFKKEMKGLSMIFQFTGQDSAARFQAHKKDYIFGLIPVNYNEATEIYNFQTTKSYHETLCKAILE